MWTLIFTVANNAINIVLIIKTCAFHRYQVTHSTSCFPHYHALSYQYRCCLGVYRGLTMHSSPQVPHLLLQSKPSSRSKTFQQSFWFHAIAADDCGKRSCPLVNKEGTTMKYHNQYNRWLFLVLLTPGLLIALFDRPPKVCADCVGY